MCGEGWPFTTYHLLGYPLALFITIIQNMKPFKSLPHFRAVSNFAMGIIDTLKKYRERNSPQKAEDKLKNNNIANILESFDTAQKAFEADLRANLEVKTRKIIRLRQQPFSAQHSWVGTRTESYLPIEEIWAWKKPSNITIQGEMIPIPSPYA